jgi:hypothetical protein
VVQFLGEFVASGLAAKPPIVVPVLRKPANIRERGAMLPCAYPKI